MRAMKGMHARKPKGFVLEEALERYAGAIETDPARWAGRWARACHPISHDGTDGFDGVWLDIGCGKGTWVSQMAKRNPDILFIGIDCEPMCVARTAEIICENGLDNAVAVPGLASDAHRFFGPGELRGISANFPTPFPRKKDSCFRITHMDRLLEYRYILADGASLHLRTDSLPLRDFTLEQMRWAGWEIVWASDDARAERPDFPLTEYEAKLSAKGAVVHAIEMRPGREPESPEQRSSLSLVDFLPEDLSQMPYVPHGMERAVVNLLNRAEREDGTG